MLKEELWREITDFFIDLFVKRCTTQPGQAVRKILKEDIIFVTQHKG
jgi:hypothetical protein